MKYSWETHEITDAQQLQRMFNTFVKRSLPNGTENAPCVVCMDTETTGLNIVHDSPFLIQWGFVDNTTNKGYSFLVDRDRYPELATQVLHALNQMGAQAKYYVGHNLGFDLHMSINAGVPYEHNNLVDTQTLIRLCSDAVPTDRGGPPMKLKEYAARYVTPDAKYHEQQIDKARTRIASTYNRELTTTCKLAGLLIKDVRPILEDKLTDVEDLTEPLASIYKEWYAKIPLRIRQNMKELFVDSDDIPYNIIDRQLLHEYSYNDIVYTLEIFYALYPLVSLRKQESTLQRESNVIRPFMGMEREGFYMNKPYIIQAKSALKTYLKQRKQDLIRYAGMQLTENQQDVILHLLNTKFNVPAEGTGKEILERFASVFEETEPDNPALPFINTVLELRTLTKWYSTYLMRFYIAQQWYDMVYTQINSAGAVTGRVSSDFQQFPKDAIKSTYTQEALFEPRRMVLAPPNTDGLLYLDYSQIELRFQAFYTILVGNPDLNLCRAYMPYKCVSKVTGEKFNFRKPEVVSRWNSKEWVLEEDPTQEWIATDVHSATTSEAYPELDTHSPKFKSLRGKVGKRTNFAKNYGATRRRIREMFPHLSEDEITRIDSAYYLAFPGVKTYHQYCYDVALSQGYGTNLFGRRYYNISGHNLINALIQGSGADLLKDKIIELHNFLTSNGYRTTMHMNIHDEISFIIRDKEYELLYKLKEIMQELPGCFVPIVAESEYTSTTWADKDEVHSVEDIERIRNEQI